MLSVMLFYVVCIVVTCSFVVVLSGMEVHLFRHDMMQDLGTCMFVPRPSAVPVTRLDLWTGPRHRVLCHLRLVGLAGDGLLVHVLM